MPRSLRLFAILAVLASSTVASLAQVQTGTPPFGSFSGGPDVINLANLNSHLCVPVLHKTGRGTNFAYDLCYDSSVWSPVVSGSTTTWNPAINWGWTGTTLTTTGYAQYITGTGSCRFFQETQWVTEYYTRYTFKGYVDPFGTFHAISTSVVDPAADCGPQNTTATATARDGSGYTLAVDNGPDATLYTRTGSVSQLPLNTPAAGEAFTDRNGNIISTDTSGHFFDTLSSTTPVLTVAGSGTPSSPKTFTYTAPSGASAVYTVKYTTYSIQTNFGCSTVTDYGTNGTTTANLVSEIDLPDISSNPSDKYRFTYEATPGHSASLRDVLHP